MRRALPVLLLLAGTAVGCTPARGPVHAALSARPLTVHPDARGEALRLATRVSRSAYRTPLPSPPRPPSRPAATKPAENMPGDIPAVWRALVQCEASGDWQYGGPHGHTDPGFTEFLGGPNFTLSTWLAYRLPGMPYWPYDASPHEQIEVAMRVLRAQGPRAWPHCSRVVGLQRSDATW